MSKEVKRYGAESCSRRLGLFVRAEDYDALLAERDALKAAHGWVSTAERMPDPGQIVHALFAASVIPVPLRKNGPSPRPGRSEWDFMDGDSCHQRVRYWMPIPALPATQGEQP